MTPQSRIKREIKDLLEARGAFWSAVQGGAGSKIGDPDLVVCYRGMYIGIEAKTPVGVQSQWQKTREREIRAAGGVYVLARCADDVRRTLDNIDKKETK